MNARETGKASFPGFFVFVLQIAHLPDRTNCDIFASRFSSSDFPLIVMSCAENSFEFDLRRNDHSSRSN
jgi:hypothetical protein